MIIKDIDNLELPEYIIIGGGPAGITLAIQLEKKNRKVLLIEAGGREFNEKIQSHYKGDVYGDKYFDLEYTRLRYLGGSSNHWGGNCAPLDRYDIEKWPLNFNEIDSFKKETKNILEIKNNFVKNESSIFNSFELSSIENGYVNFGEKYYDQLKKSQNIFLLMETSVLNLESNENGKEVTSINLKIKNKSKKIILNLNKVIVACGGLENSRLLLWSKEISKNSFLKNLPIGKYWMEHPSGEIGHCIGKKDVVEKVFKKKNYFLVPSENFIKNEKINNVRFSVQFWEANGKKSLKHILKDLVCLAPNYGKKIIESFSNQVVHCVSAIKFSVEQKPKIENDITLSKTKFDKYKIPQIKLNWNIGDDVFFTLKKSLEKLGQEFIENDIGRIGIDKYVYDQSFKKANDIFANHHHMGGTIMSNLDNVGVVDQNLRVKNTSNLYVLGSSVFPTGGHFNPTFTIVQLSLRLAKHLTT